MKNNNNKPPQTNSDSSFLDKLFRNTRFIITGFTMSYCFRQRLYDHMLSEDQVFHELQQTAKYISYTSATPLFPFVNIMDEYEYALGSSSPMSFNEDKLVVKPLPSFTYQHHDQQHHHHHHDNIHSCSASCLNHLAFHQKLTIEQFYFLVFVMVIVWYIRDTQNDTQSQKQRVFERLKTGLSKTTVETLEFFFVFIYMTLLKDVDYAF